MMTKDNGGPAFPTSDLWMPNHEQVAYGNSGMTLRQYAAIKLRVPDSGTDWLDEMITKSLRDDFAGKALQGLVCEWSLSTKDSANGAYVTADAMMEVRKK